MSYCYGFGFTGTRLPSRSHVHPCSGQRSERHSAALWERIAACACGSAACGARSDWLAGGFCTVLLSGDLQGLCAGVRNIRAVFRRTVASQALYPIRRHSIACDPRLRAHAPTPCKKAVRSTATTARNTKKPPVHPANGPNSERLQSRARWHANCNVPPMENAVTRRWIHRVAPSAAASVASLVTAFHGTRYP